LTNGNSKQACTFFFFLISISDNTLWLLSLVKFRVHCESPIQIAPAPQPSKPAQPIQTGMGASGLSEADMLPTVLPVKHIWETKITLRNGKIYTSSCLTLIQVSPAVAEGKLNKILASKCCLSPIRGEANSII